MTAKPRVEIEYCPRCRWLLRAAWMAQELLTTFEAELGAVTLIPSETGGAFEVRADGAILWSRAAEGRFQLTNFLLRGMAVTALWDDDRTVRNAALKTWRATIAEMAAAARGRPPPHSREAATAPTSA